VSERKDVYDALVNALSASTSQIAYVTRKYENWWDWPTNKFPAVRVMDMSEEFKPLSYPAGTTTVDDMESSMTFKVSGYVQDITNQGLSTARSDLINAIQRIVMTDSTMAAKVADIWPISVETDEGVLDNFAWCELTFKARYFYNHAAT
jgi:hypothetical protein